MIRTKDALIEALANKAKDGKIYGHQKNKPSAPWSYSIDTAEGSVTVHGNAVHAAAVAKQIYLVRSHWNHCAYRVSRNCIPAQ